MYHSEYLDLNYCLSSVTFRSRLVIDDHTSYDQQRGGTYSIGGGGETHLEVARRMLMLRQQKLKKKLEAIKKQRNLIRHDRAKRKVPIVSVVGYTNAGRYGEFYTEYAVNDMQFNNYIFTSVTCLEELFRTDRAI